MKKSIFSIFTAVLAFVSLQTADAQTKPTTQKEAQQLYDAVMESKAEVDNLVKKGIVIHEAKGGSQDGVAIPDAKSDPNDIIIIDMVKTLEDTQDFCNRVEATGGDMTAAQLTAFKAELAKIDAQLAKMESQQTQNLTGTALQNCWNACKSVWPKWWHTLHRVACYAGCLLL